jgi:hypothetical protein
MGRKLVDGVLLAFVERSPSGLLMRATVRRWRARYERQGGDDLMSGAAAV